MQPEPGMARGAVLLLGSDTFVQTLMKVYLQMPVSFGQL